MCDAYALQATPVLASGQMPVSACPTNSGGFFFRRAPGDKGDPAKQTTSNVDVTPTPSVQPTLYPQQPKLLGQEQFLGRPPESLNPQDRWLQKQLETLQEYHRIAQEYKMLMRRHHPGHGHSSEHESVVNTDPMFHDVRNITGTV